MWHALRFWKGKVGVLISQVPSASKFHLDTRHSQSKNSVNNTFPNNNCVIFRLDDVPYDLPIYNEDRIKVDQAVLNVFKRKNQCLSLGLVMHYIDRHQNLLKDIIEGFDNGIFELAIHGWDHLDYSKMKKSAQESSFLMANEKMQKLFGRPSKIFVPPYNEFNRSTLDALKVSDIKVISSSTYSDYHKFFVAKKAAKWNQANGIYHLPEMTSFEKFSGMKPIRVPLERIVNNIENKIGKYGYCIVTIHPQSLIKFQEGKSIDQSLKDSVLDMERIAELESLLQIINDRDISVTSFSRMVGLE